jgi:hypothetical protein
MIPTLPRRSPLYSGQLPTPPSAGASNWRCPLSRQAIRRNASCGSAAWTADRCGFVPRMPAKANASMLSPPIVNLTLKETVLPLTSSKVGVNCSPLTFSRILDRSQLEFPTVRSSRFVVGFLCLSSLANAAGGKFANELCGRWTL